MFYIIILVNIMIRIYVISNDHVSDRLYECETPISWGDDLTPICRGGSFDQFLDSPLDCSDVCAGPDPIQVCSSLKQYSCQCLNCTYRRLSDCNCVPQSDCATDICAHEANPGLCKAFMTRWYFNSLSETCEQFIYGGCGGNENNFETELDCIHGCAANRPG